MDNFIRGVEISIGETAHDLGKTATNIKDGYQSGAKALDAFLDTYYVGENAEENVAELTAKIPNTAEAFVGGLQAFFELGETAGKHLTAAADKMESLDETMQGIACLMTDVQCGDPREGDVAVDKAPLDVPKMPEDPALKLPTK